MSALECHRSGCAAAAVWGYVWPGRPGLVFGCAAHARMAVRVAGAMGLGLTLIEVALCTPQVTEAEPGR